MPRPATIRASAGWQVCYFDTCCSPPAPACAVADVHGDINRALHRQRRRHRDRQPDRAAMERRRQRSVVGRTPPTRTTSITNTVWSATFSAADGTAYTNSSRRSTRCVLCGHCDWRLPTIDELQTILLIPNNPCGRTVPRSHLRRNARARTPRWSSIGRRDDGGQPAARLRGDGELLRRGAGSITRHSKLCESGANQSVVNEQRSGATGCVW